MQDHFPEAAVRHYLDGETLHHANRYDNAMCHYAFSAECAIKAFWMQFCNVYAGLTENRSHDVKDTLESITTYHELMGIMMPQLSVLIGVDGPPPILFQEHPGRRYGNDVTYTASELEECKAFTGRLMQQIISAAIDGKLDYESERGAL